MNVRLLVTLPLVIAASFVGSARAEEVDAVVDDLARSVMKRKQDKEPDQFTYGRLKVDTKGRVVSKANITATIRPGTKFTMGRFNEKTKSWTDGEPIAGGPKSELFTAKGKTLRIAVFLADDKKTIERVVVKNTDEKLEQADKEYFAHFKEIGLRENIGTTIWKIRQELDDQGNVVKTFGLSSGFVRKDTKIAMGKFNAATKKWEAGEPIEKGLDAEIFQDLDKKKLQIYVIPRDDRQGIAELLVLNGGN